MVAGDPLDAERGSAFRPGDPVDQPDPTEHALPEAPRTGGDRARGRAAEHHLGGRQTGGTLPKPPRRAEGGDAGRPPPDRCTVPRPGVRTVERDVAGRPQGGRPAVTYLNVWVAY